MAAGNHRQYSSTQPAAAARGRCCRRPCQQQQVMRRRCASTHPAAARLAAVIVLSGVLLFSSPVACHQQQHRPAWDAPGVRWLDVASQLPSLQAEASSVGTAAVRAAPAISRISSSSSGGGPSADALRAFLQTCGRQPGSSASGGASSCLYLQQAVGCGLLEVQGYLPPATAITSFVPPSAGGNFSLPGSCGASPLSLLQQQAAAASGGPALEFNGHGTHRVVALIARGRTASQVFFFGRGASVGHATFLEQPSSLELCLAPPAEGSLQASQTASYSPGLTPGSVGWQLAKSVQLPPAFSDGTVHMFAGDTVEAAWTLAATKQGEEATRQGVVSGTISIANGRPQQAAVYGVLVAVKGGPSAEVSCGPSFPFKVPACSTVVCTYTARYPQLPTPGSYQVVSSVQFQQQGDKAGASVGVAEAASGFEVGSAPDGFKSAAHGRVPPGQAVVTDTQLPGQRLAFTGSGQQSYVTRVRCPASGSVVNSATLLASTGQEVSATASVLKNCYELRVRLLDISGPDVARWQWSVQHSVSTSVLQLRSGQKPLVDFLLQQLDAATARGDNTTALQAELNAVTKGDGPGAPPTTGDVTYTVKVTRSLPRGAGGGAAPSPYSMRGRVLVSNPAPINARLAGVVVTLADPSGQAADYAVEAACPLLTVASGQDMVCQWSMAPPFNPIGARLVATARYAATLNGAGLSGDVQDFASPALLVGSQQQAPEEGSSSSSSSSSGQPRAQQTFGSGLAALASSAGARMRRALLQWSSPAGLDAAAPAFDAASFLAHVWGHTGASTIISHRGAAASAPARAASVSGAARLDTQQRAPDAHSWQQQPAELPRVLDGSGHALPMPLHRDSAPPAKAAAGNTSSTSSSVGVAALGKRLAAAAQERPQGTNGAGGRVSVASVSPAGSSTAGSRPLDGLLDDCADISSELASELGLMSGRLVGGELPAGRVCADASFVFTVRYGPYDSCGSGRRALTSARLVAADSRRVSSSLSEVDVGVSGCRAPVAATLAELRPSADMRSAWSMQLTAQHDRLLLAPGATATNSYTAVYSRTRAASAPRLVVQLSLRNTGPATDVIGAASYMLNTSCGGAEQSRTAAFVCAANKLPPAAITNCSFVVPLPCAAKGALQAQLQLASGGTISTPASPFDAPDLNLDRADHASAADGGGGDDACVEVSQVLKRRPGLGAAGIVDGTPPQGQICRPTTFTFTRQFGPYATCGTREAVSVASLRTPDGASVSNSLQTDVHVEGCSEGSSAEAARRTSAETAASRVSATAAVATAAAPPPNSKKKQRQHAAHPSALAAAVATSAAAQHPAAGWKAHKPKQQQQQKLPRGACVRTPWFWKHCMLAPPAAGDDPACSVVVTALPGGLGARTPFFPYARRPAAAGAGAGAAGAAAAPSRSRTYRQLMVMQANVSGDAALALHIRAAQAFIATQLNAAAGVALPPPVRSAYGWLGKDYFARHDEHAGAAALRRHPSLRTQLEAAAALLADFSRGALPAGRGGLPRCAMLRDQQQHQQQWELPRGNGSGGGGVAVASATPRLQQQQQAAADRRGNESKQRHATKRRPRPA